MQQCSPSVFRRKTILIFQDEIAKDIRECLQGHSVGVRSCFNRLQIQNCWTHEMDGGNGRDPCRTLTFLCISFPP